MKSELNPAPPICAERVEVLRVWAYLAPAWKLRGPTRSEGDFR